MGHFVEKLNFTWLLVLVSHKFDRLFGERRVHLTGLVIIIHYLSSSSTQWCPKQTHSSSILDDVQTYWKTNRVESVSEENFPSVSSVGSNIGPSNPDDIPGCLVVHASPQ